MAKNKTQLKELNQREIEIMINNMTNYLYSYHSQKFDYHNFTNFVEKYIKTAFFIAEAGYLEDTKQNIQLNDYNAKYLKEHIENRKQNESDKSIDMTI